ncbi:MAG: glycosyltransferase family 1 protein [bacterium]
MRIAVNALFLRWGRVGGSEIALAGLLGGLVAIAPQDRIRVYVARSEAKRERFPAGVEVVGCGTRTRPRAGRIAWEQLVLPQRIARDGHDVLWNAGFTAPALSPVPQVTSVYDLQHLVHPEHFRASHRIAWRVLVDLALARSDRVVCASAAAGRDLVRSRPSVASRLRHVPLGVDPAWLEASRDDPLPRWMARVGVQPPFALCVGTTHPHKGHAVLLDAWRRMVERGSRPPMLVLTGVRGFADRRIGARVCELGLGAHVRHLGWVPRAELAQLYRAARLVLMPTRFEGFGLPLLEALAQGAPVVASALPVLEETGGDAVCWVAPDDVAGWADAVDALAADDVARARMASRGRVQAAGWTWERAARGLRRVLVEAAYADGFVDGGESGGV